MEAPHHYFCALPMRTFLFLLLLAGSPLFSGAQTLTGGTILDARSGEPLPFASLKAEPSGEGTVADVDGQFRFTVPAGTVRILVSFVGYNARTVLPASLSQTAKIALEPDGKTSLAEVQIRPDDSKVRRLIALALKNRDRHNPELRKEYQCRMYYKMTFDFGDSKGFDSGKLDGMDSFNARQHLIVTETYSRRYHRRPALLNEEIVATRFSGLKNPVFTNLITQVLPFHVGGDFVRLNEKDYPNPVAAGYDARYKFYIAEELLQPGGDTLWVINFRPQPAIDGLRGQLYLNADGYAVTQMRAEARDTVLGHLTRMDIQYRKDAAAGWVPDKLNYVLDWYQPDTKRTQFYARGTSRIDSFSFALPAGYKFDRAHTATVLPEAESQPETFWEPYRRDSFTVKDAETYRFNDSLGQEIGFDDIMGKITSLSRGFVPLGPVELDLQRIYSYNRFEGSRWGLGLQTSDSISRKFTLGGWAGYGTKDKKWKYGGAATFSFDKYREHQLQLRYDNDLRDPGRFALSQEFNATYLRQYLLQRADAFEAVTLTLRNRMGFLATELEGTLEKVTPRYEYRFVADGITATRFEAQKATLRLRWAYGENRALSMGRYYGIGTKYPVLYANISAGNIRNIAADGSSTTTTPFAQVLAGVQWEGHVNRWGKEQLFILGGKTFSSAPLPLSYLFAGNGYRLSTLAFYSFGAFYTLRPYEVYSSSFASIHYRHQFDFKFYKRPRSAPSLAVGANYMLGKLDQPEGHQNVSFFTPNTGYGEAGLALHDLLKLNYLNLAYLNVHAGYYVPLQGSEILKRGAAVVGIGFDL